MIKFVALLICLIGSILSKYFPLHSKYFSSSILFGFQDMSVQQNTSQDALTDLLDLTRNDGSKGIKLCLFQQ
jgi:hypothetical protein